MSRTVQHIASILSSANLGTPENGLEQFYNLADALAMAAWLNVFVRQADIVEIACIAQSVNVISPLITRCVVPFSWKSKL